MNRNTTYSRRYCEIINLLTRKFGNTNKRGQNTPTFLSYRDKERYEENNQFQLEFESDHKNPLWNRSGVGPFR